jgi:hypothetical protein
LNIFYKISLLGFVCISRFWGFQFWLIPHHETRPTVAVFEDNSRERFMAVSEGNNNEQWLSWNFFLIQSLKSHLHAPFSSSINQIDIPPFDGSETEESLSYWEFYVEESANCKQWKKFYWKSFFVHQHGKWGQKSDKIMLRKEIFTKVLTVIDDIWKNWIKNDLTSNYDPKFKI